MAFLIVSGSNFEKSFAEETPFEALNNLFEAVSVPGEATDASNLATSAASFVDSGSDDYRLVATSEAVDAGFPISGVLTDRIDIFRPQAAAFDVGAFEFDFSAAVPEPTAATLVAFAVIMSLFLRRRARRIYG